MLFLVECDFQRVKQIMKTHSLFDNNELIALNIMTILLFLPLFLFRTPHCRAVASIGDTAFRENALSSVTFLGYFQIMITRLFDYDYNN